MRVIHKVEDGQYKALVRSKNQWGDYVVQFFVGGVHNQDADYFTDDRGDAEGTADAWVKPAPVMIGTVRGGKVTVDVVGAEDAAAFMGAGG